jgi:hypothetical protein
MKVAAGVVISVLALGDAAGDSPALYRCDNGGATVYSDRPCAADARPHQLDDSRVTVYEALPRAERAASSRTNQRASRQSRASRDSAASYEKHQIKCDRLGRSLRDVRTKMRTGYGVDEGERLKERHRQLTAQRRAEKCR